MKKLRMNIVPLGGFDPNCKIPPKNVHQRGSNAMSN